MQFYKLHMNKSQDLNFCTVLDIDFNKGTFEAITVKYSSFIKDFLCKYFSTLHSSSALRWHSISMITHSTAKNPVKEAAIESVLFIFERDKNIFLIFLGALKNF